MANDKQYRVTVGGESQIWDAEKYERNKDLLTSSYPDAKVEEVGYMSANEEQVIPGEKYRVTIGNEQQEWDSEKLNRNKGHLLQQYPDAKIERLGVIGSQSQQEQNDNVETNFFKGMHQTNKNIWRAGLWHSLSGEIANLFTGSSREEAAALNDIEYLESLGIDPKGYLEDIDFRQRYGMDRAQFETLSRKERRALERAVVEKELAYPISVQEQILQEREQRESVMKAYRDALAEAGGDLDKAKEILKTKAEDKTWGDKQLEKANAIVAENKELQGAAKWGGLAASAIPSAAALGLAFLTKGRSGKVSQWLNTATKVTGNVGMAGMAGGTAGLSMIEARQHGATNWQVWTTGIADGLIEFITEKIPFDKLTKPVLTAAKTKTTKALMDAMRRVDSPGRKELEKLLTEANKKLGGKLLNGKNVVDWLANAATEGVSEATAEALQTVTSMIYLNPEEYPTFAEAANAAWEGAKGGMALGGVIGGAGKAVEHSLHKDRRKQQGFVNVALVEQDGKNPFVAELVDYDPETKTYKALQDGEIVDVEEEEIQYKHQYTYNEFESGRYKQLEDEAIADGTVSDAQVAVSADRLGNARQKLENLMTEAGMTDEQKNATFADLEAGDMPGFPADAKALWDATDEYTEAFKRDKEIQSAKDVKAENERKAVLDAMTQQMGGEFWQKGSRTMQENGMEIIEPDTVEIGTMQDGKQVFILSTPNDSGEVAVITEDGKKMFIRHTDLQDGTTIMPLQEFLDARVTEQKRVAEQERMAEEAAPQLDAIRQKYQMGTQVNLGTEESPTLGQVIGIKPENDGVFIQTEAGIVPYTYEQLADIAGTPIRVMTDAQMAAAEAAEIEAAESARMSELAETPEQMTDAETVGDNAVQMENMATETPLPLNSDGSVNQDALFKESPARWAEWNDERKQDGGASSAQYISGKLAKAQAKLAELQTAYAVEDSLNKKELLEKAVADQQGVVDELVGIMQKYAPSEPAPVQTESAQPAPAATQQERTTESVLASLNDGTLTDEEIRANIDANLAEAQKAYDKYAKKAPKMGTDKDAYLAEKQKYEQGLPALQQEIDFWNGVKQTYEGAMQQETLPTEESFRPELAEEDMEPHTPQELAARELGLKEGGIKLLWDSVKAHTGFGDGERQKFFGMFRSKDKGGMTIEAAGERLMEIDREYDLGLLDQSDPMAGVNAILDVLGDVQTIGDLRNYIANNREVRVAREAAAAYSAMNAEFEATHGMTMEENALADHVAMLELMSGKALSDAEQYEINVKFAEEENQYGTNEYQSEAGEASRGESGENQSDVARGADGSYRQGDSVLQEAQSDNTGGETISDGQTEGDFSESDEQDGDTSVHGGEQAAEVSEAPLRAKEDAEHLADPLAMTIETRLKIMAETREAIHERVNTWSDKLGIKINIIDNYRDVQNEGAKKNIAKGNMTFGWFEQSTGEIFIYVPVYLNYRTETALKEVEKTILHEGIAHKGMREMLGEEKYGELCDKVWNEVMTEKQRKEFIKYPGVNGNTRAAADEFIASVSENVKQDTIWDKIANFFKDILNSIGIEIKVADNDLKGLLKQSYQRYRKGEAKTNPSSNKQAEGKTSLRSANGSLVGMHNISEDKLRKVLKQGGLANPSTAVVNIAEYLLDGYGDISLIMPSSLVDANTGDNIGTYTGDAWTPTYPPISRKVDDNGWKVIKDLIRSVVSEDSPLYHDIINGLENYLEDNRSSKMEFVFLKEKGIEPEIAYKGADGFVGMRNLEAILGVQGLRDGLESYERYKNASPMAKRSFNMWLDASGNKQAHRELKEQLKKEPKLADVLKFNEDVSFADFDSFTYDIFRKEQDAGRIDTYDTMGAAARYVDANNLRGEFEAWLESLMEQAGAKEVFFAGYTRDGDRIYKDNTLENVSRHMRLQGRANAYDDHGLSATKSALLQRLTSLSQIRKNKARLQNESAYNKEYDALKDRLFSIISQLADMQEISSNRFMNVDYAESRLQEAITKRNPIAHLNKEYGYGIDPAGEYADELNSFIKDVQQMPAKYFETKFERPVYLNEFAAAVMPTTTSEDIKQAVSEAGLPIFEYDPSVEGSRKEATLKATEGEGIRFRTAPSDRVLSLFNQARAGELGGKPISIGSLTKEGKEYLERISGIKLKENVSFVLNPSDLNHIYNDHYGKNEKDTGNNIPLNDYDIRRLVDVIAFPTRVVFGEDKQGRKVFYFLSETPSGTYNLIEIYANKKGNLTAKTYYKTKKGATQRVMELESLLSTSETYSGATLSDAKIPILFDIANQENDNTLFRTRVTPEQDAAYLKAVEAGDMDTAQRMVDETADRVMKNSKVRDSRGKLIRVTHYSPNEFTSFDPQKIGSSTDWGVFGRGFYFSNKDHRLYGKNRYEGYLNLENPFIINGAEEAYAYKEAIADFAGVQYYEVGKKETDDYTDYLISQGYDGVIYNDTFSGFNEYVAFYPYQFKLADVVDVETKDDNGNVIPLSERFNEEKDDIRFRTSNNNDEFAKRSTANNIIDRATAFVNGTSIAKASEQRRERERKRKEEAAEIYSRVLNNQFDDVTLQLIDKYIQDATPKNPYGRRISQRLPQEMERGLHEGKREAAVNALFSRISESAVSEADRASQQGKKEIETKKKELLKNWAIASGMWYDNLSDVAEIADTNPIDEGTESKVYASTLDNTLVKVKRGKPFGKRFRPDIDDLVLFNHVFPNTAYTIIGYGDFGDGISTIVTQPVVNFAEDANVSVEERVEHMKSLGFKPMNKDNTAFTNGKIVASDIQGKNIVKTAEGNIRVIDADMKLHTKDMGGEHVIPPVEEDTLFRTDNTGEFSAGNNDIRFRTKYDANTNPTEAQKKAGNYKMGHIRLDGYNITIENPKGSVRRGTDSKGNAWENTLNNDYGYIRGTEGVDGDHIDVYLSDNPTEGNVFVIDQVNPETREFDEHKVMYGFDSDEEAREAYLANFSEGWNGLGTITEVSKDEFKKWIESSHRKTKPFSEYKSVRTNEMQATDESDLRYRVVTNQETLDRLNSEPTIKVYRAMQVIDGKLYPPMSAKVDGKLREPIELGQWEEAEERPDLADEKGNFKLDKGNKTSVPARYNPYFHTSRTPLNDQFSSAQTRPNLVTVEVEVPESELTSGYKAEKAKDSVGEKEWKAGIIQGKLSGTRKVILSRWDKPVRIVPDSEVAERIVEMFDGRNITMPSNVVTPSLRTELEKLGIPFIETNNQGKPIESTQFRTTGTPTEQVVKDGLVLSNEDFTTLAGNIFSAMPEDVRRKVVENAARDNYDLKKATLQMSSSLAEKAELTDEEIELAKMVAQKVEDAVLASGVEMTRPFTTNEALWVLYQSIYPTSEYDLIGNARKAVVADNLGFSKSQQEEQEKDADNIRFRSARGAAANSAAAMYNNEQRSAWGMLRETYQDMYRSVKSLMQSIEKTTGKVAQSWENILTSLNALSSKNLADKKKYLRDFLTPMWDAALAIRDKYHKSLEQIERYLMIKHGLERNKVLAARDARNFYREQADREIAAIKADKSLSKAEQKARIQRIEDTYDNHVSDIEAGIDAKFQEFRAKDYGGLTALFSDFADYGTREDYESEELYQEAALAARTPKYATLAETELAAQQEVDAFETEVDKALIDNLWKKINAATKETLRHQYANNMLTKEQYERVRDMFEFYVPLRGFVDTTAEDTYSYYVSGQQSKFANPLQGAKGRKTQAETPLGWIGSMAESAIQMDNKNTAKLALYYFAVNRPNNDILKITPTWYEWTGEVDSDGKKIFEPVYPTFNGPQSGPAMQSQMDAFESTMEQQAQAGNAYKGKQRIDLKEAVIRAPKSTPEHVVTVKVAGEDYSIIINANPRAAQAINGMLNVETRTDWFHRATTGLLRYMAAISTSYSPLFWIKNFMRDVSFAFINTSIRHDAGYTKEFAKNYPQAFRVFSYVHKNRKAALGDSKYEKYYTEFAENGGITGYTSLTNNTEYDQIMKAYANDARAGKFIRGMKSAFEVFQNVGESFEQVSRFAAYITARESGKDISESIYEAKEVTINFNRKGSGRALTMEEAKKFRRKNGKKLTVPERIFFVTLAGMSPFAREFYMFFNAGMQGVRMIAKLAHEHPGKSAAWAGIAFTMGLINAIMHAMMEDDDEYLDMPDYVRRTNILIGKNGTYFMWSLPHEIRPFYAMADIFVQHAMGRKPNKNIAAELAEAFGEWLPINPFKDGMNAFVPDFVKIVAEIKDNKDFTGSPIYREYRWLTEEQQKNMPAYEKGFDSTSKVLVDVSEMLNDLSGGDQTKAGFININPAVVEHLAQKFGGGPLKLAEQFFKTIGVMTGDQEFSIRNTPFLSTFMVAADDRYRNAHTTELFKYYKGMADDVKRRAGEYKAEKDKEGLDKLRASDDFQIFQIYRKYEKRDKFYNEQLKRAKSDSERKEIMSLQDAHRKRMIEEISRL